MRTSLRGRRRFAEVRATRRPVTAGRLRLHVAGNGLAVARVGFVIRDVPSAVVRNRLRRRLRAALRPRLAELAGLDVVITGRPPAAAAASYALLEGDLARCVSRLAAGLARAGSGPLPSGREPLLSEPDGAPPVMGGSER